MLRRTTTVQLSLFIAWFASILPADTIDLFDSTQITGSISSFADGVVEVQDLNGKSRLIPIEDATAVSFDPRTNTINENRRLVYAGHTGDDSPVRLRAGYHKLVIVYAGNAPKLQYSLDGEIPTMVPPSIFYTPETIKNFKPSVGLDSEGFRLPESPGNVKQGATYRQYSCSQPLHTENLNDAPLKFVKSGRTDDIQSSWTEKSTALGIFTTMVHLESDGEYRFLLAGNKKATLHLGATPPEIMALMKRRQAPQATWLVELADGGGLIAGNIDRWRDNLVHLKTPYAQLPILHVPIEHVQQIVRAGNAIETTKTNIEEDVVIAMVNDERTTRIVGHVNGIEDDKLSVRYKNQDRFISLDKVVKLTLGGPKYSLPRVCYQQLELSAVCSIPTTLQSVTETGIVAKTAWGQELSIAHDGAALLQLRIRNGRVQYLSEITPAKVEETPFFDRMIHWQADRSLTGTTLVIGKSEFRRGLAMHSRTKLSYDLAGGYDQFMAVVGLSPEFTNLGDATIQVIGDGEVLFEKEQLTGSEEINLSVQISGVQLLTLVTDFGQGQDVGDRVHWGNARIVRQAK